MRRIAVIVFAIASCLPLVAQGSSPAPADGPLEGTWVGELKAGAVVLRIVFNVTSTAGVLSATMDSPDQGARGIPVSRVEMKGRHVILEVKSAAGACAGDLSADGKSIEGTWSQSGRSFPILLKKNDGPFILIRPQDPKPPFPYASTEVSFTNQKAGLALSGTLTMPAGAGPFPAVVLVSGSGPQNRDEELMGHKPFLVIADFLSRNGVAVLRYDDRGVAGSKGDFASATILDFADDAEAAFSFLCSRPGLDAKSAGILGHSEAAIVAPFVAARNPAVRFIVMLAGMGMKGEDLLLLQNAALARAAGANDRQIEDANKTNRAIYDVAARESDPQRARDQLRRIVSSSKVPDAALAQLLSQWFRTFLTLDPTVPLATLKISVLAMGGSKDLQVPADQNLPAIKAALDKAGNTRYRVVRLDGLNHLFQHASSGLPAEYGTLTETFAPEALTLIRDFILSVR